MGDLMVEIVAVIFGSSALAGAVAWLASRRRDRAEVTAIDVATTSHLAAEFIAANRQLVAAEYRSDRVLRHLAEVVEVVDRLEDRLGADDVSVVRLRRLTERMAPAESVSNGSDDSP